ncbi:MAG: hypothetical protein ACI9XO_001805 [Paraglaciecola sp.]|jgi:uncharacterized protein (DUF488 family)
MTKLYTIGFTKKSAEDFFTLIDENEVQNLVDTRIRNNSQLAGFAKGRDLKYFTNCLCNANYSHELDYAPTKELLQKYRKKEIDWSAYEIEYLNLLDFRKVAHKVDISQLHQHCFLCSEHLPDFCHRRLLAEYLKAKFNDIKIKHLW